ncbi:MAG TPA: SgcJ/EcaC family oxidoreductase [Gemmatimonadaceae bacterium]|jgi:uncharacterized protein (TIGR02246 family)
MTTQQPVAAANADAEIRALIAAQAAAWNRHDAAAWASPFTPAAEFINILGTPFSGRPAIEGITARIFSSFFRTTHDSVTVQNVVLVTPDIAVAQFEHAVTGYTALPTGILPSTTGADGNGVLRTRMTYVLQRTGDHGWAIVHGQNTAILPPVKLP